MTVTGKPIDRKDGRAKVTGAAKYAAEFNQTNMAYAFPVRSTIAKGTITAFDTSAAEKSGGVLAVLTHKNAVRLKAINPEEQMKAGATFLGEDLPPLQDNKIDYFGQFVALVVAETYEQARHAAGLLKISYAAEKHAVDLKSELPNGFTPEKLFGEEAQINTDKAAPLIAATPHKIEHTYTYFDGKSSSDGAARERCRLGRCGQINALRRDAGRRGDTRNCSLFFESQAGKRTSDFALRRGRFR